jgi:tRNA(Ile)-lysidine synthase
MFYSTIGNLISSSCSFLFFYLHIRRLFQECYNPCVLNRFQRYLRDECKIMPGASLIAAVSGGADSLCLLELLVASGFQPVVAHFNHHLRPDAQADADFVAQQASKLGCRFVYGEEKVAELARSEKLSIEAAARQARYKFLFAAAQAAGAEALVTGHNADDQVETVLLHFLRGSGLDGLNGMSARSRLPQFSADIDLVRPLLGFWRNEIDAFLQGEQPAAAAGSDQYRPDLPAQSSPP